MPRFVCALIESLAMLRRTRMTNSKVGFLLVLMFKRMSLGGIPTALGTPWNPPFEPSLKLPQTTPNEPIWAVAFSCRGKCTEEMTKLSFPDAKACMPTQNSVTGSLGMFWPYLPHTLLASA